MGDTDVLGAMGLADKALTSGKHSDGTVCRPTPLAVVLARLFTGDNSPAPEIVQILAQKLLDRARKFRPRLNAVQAEKMAQACLAWHRNGTCQPCGGLGKTLIPGSRSLSSHDCQHCRGTGKMLFEHQFRQEHHELARWLLAQVEEDAGRAYGNGQAGSKI